MVRFAARYEMARSVEDVLARRLEVPSGITTIRSSWTCGLPQYWELRKVQVAMKTRVESFGKKFIKLRRERVNMADARRARRHAFLRVLLEFHEVKNSSRGLSSSRLC